ncbi:MAG: HDOD domain-containing protein [Planctomycetes bacterium]|nr:HDOD domain-containing protein [Planctomycetota bacterium]
MGAAEEQSRKRRKIRRKVRETDSLPAAPSVLMELDQMLESSHPRIATIAAIVAKDASIAARILNVVNASEYFDGHEETWDIRQAVAMLGVEEVRRLVSALSVVSAFPTTLDHVDYRDFWRHSIGVAGAARLLAVYSYSGLAVDPEEAYTAGLMHDVGWLLLECCLPDIADGIMRMSLGESMPRLKAERALMGTDHGDIGGMLLERWHQRPEIVEGVAWHHDPGSAEKHGRGLAAIVHLGDRICIAGRVGDSGEGISGGPSASEMEAVGIPVSKCSRMMENVLEAARKMSEIIVHAG